MWKIRVSAKEQWYIIKKLKNQNRLLEKWNLHNKQGRGMRLYDHNSLIIDYLQNESKLPKDSFLVHTSILQDEIVKHKNFSN